MDVSEAMGKYRAYFGAGFPIFIFQGSNADAIEVMSRAIETNTEFTFLDVVADEEAKMIDEGKLVL